VMPMNRRLRPQVPSRSPTAAGAALEHSFAASSGPEDTAMGSSLAWQTDTQLHDAVQRQLDWDPEIDATDIAIIATDGVITLTGLVHSYAAKLAAERAVKRVRGVRGVANEIQVALRNERTDTDIAKDAVHALRAHTSVPNKVTVTARHGFMTLEGTVEWMFQKTAAGLAVAFPRRREGRVEPDRGQAERVGRPDQGRHRRGAPSQRGSRRAARPRLGRWSHRDAVGAGALVPRKARGGARGVGRAGSHARRESHCCGVFETCGAEPMEFPVTVTFLGIAHSGSLEEDISQTCGEARCLLQRHCLVPRLARFAAPASRKGNPFTLPDRS